jgi:NagD protein
MSMVLGGAKLVATNPDPNCPIPGGSRPGCGAIASMLEKATGLHAFSVGKPSSVMTRLACEDIGIRPENATIIGDTMDTDILGGVQMGCKTVLVLSGGTKIHDLKKFAYRPDYVVESVAELCEELLADDCTMVA